MTPDGVHWMLVDGEPVPAPDLMTWARWFETSAPERIVAKTGLADGLVEVSTVFLALDHSHGRGKPVLWETLVFGGPLDGEMARYTSRADAEAGHLDMVERVRRAFFGPPPA